MSKNEKDTKVDNTKLEGLKAVGGKGSYNPAKEDEFEGVIFTSPVKIGDKKYIIKPLSMLDIKKLNIEKKKIKEGDETATYDFSFYSLLTVVKKFNPETRDLTLDQFEDIIDILEFERVQAAIIQISGLKKYFKQGDSGK